MDLIKKNIVSVICGLVAVVCVVLVFFPFGGMYEDLDKSVRDGWKVGTDLQGLARAQRTWPSLSPNEEDKLPLEQFPTAALISRGEQMTEGWKTAATRFLQFVINDQQQQLQLLVPGTLPSIRTSTVGREFIDQYQRRFGIYVGPNGELDQSESLFRRILDSTTPPSEVDVKKRQDEIAARVRAERTVIANGQVQNQQEVELLVAKAIADIASQYRTESARSHLMYADPLTVFDINPKIQGTSVPDVNNVFVAQITLWVQEQLCQAIRTTNDAAHNATPKPAPGVLGSPIKRLLKVQVTHKFAPALPAPGTPAGEAPVLPSNPQTKITPDYTAGPFGHASNEFYDPVKFDITMIVEARAVTPILTSLTSNRYFIFRNVQVEAVDASIDAAQGFLYGNAPVVQLRIRGSYLFLREVLKNYMPEDIIRGLTLPPGTEGMGQFPGSEF